MIVDPFNVKGIESIVFSVKTNKSSDTLNHAYELGWAEDDFFSKFNWELYRKYLNTKNKNREKIQCPRSISHGGISLLCFQAGIA